MGLKPTPSISDVAKSIIQPATPAPQEGGQSNEVVEDDQVVAPTGATEDGGAEGRDGTEDLTLDGDDQGQDEGEVLEDDTDNEEGADGQENFDTLELADDTVFSVTVDEQEVEVTLADLKKAYSGEGAIAKRLQEATEAKKLVETERQAVKQELDTGREKLVQAFRTFDALMFQPRVSKPDASLQASDPQKYLLQMEAYRQDQATIQARRSQVQSAMQQYEQQQAAEIQQERVKNAQKLVEVLPDLKDPKKGPALSQSIVEAATTHYGFSQAEIAQAYDYRIFQMAADAAAYRKLMAAQAAQKAQIVPKTKVLKPGTANAGKRTAQARGKVQAITRARQTGDVKDVAKTMILK